MGALALACRGGESEAPGRIEVAWTGADTGRLEAPAVARWCSNDTLLEIVAEVGDSGVAVTLFPPDTVKSGVYPVGKPTSSRSRPSARLGLRWFGETLIEGYHSLSGVVTVDSGGAIDGTIDATLLSVTDGGQLNLAGTFRDLRVVAGSAALCGQEPAVQPDTSVR